MISKANTLGQFVSDLMNHHQHTNRSLAAIAGVSESAVRNILKVGIDKQSKDPDARTLSLIAKALEVDALRLFRLAGYIPPEPSSHSVRADYLADVFDKLSPEKQDAVLGVLEAMTDKREEKEALRTMRQDSSNPIAGLDLNFPQLARTMANQIIATLGLIEPVEVENIPNNTQILQYKWSDLPQSTQERVKALIRHKLSLDYDPTMVEQDWRK